MFPDKRIQRAREEKRRKLTEPLGSPLSEHIFERHVRDSLREEYSSSTPYQHLVIRNLCDDARARAVFAEARGSLRADFKETDLFKVYQTPDLANLGANEIDPTTEKNTDAEDDGTERLESTIEAASKLEAPQLVALREAIYSQRFRELVSELSGCGELEPRADCSVNAYANGGHLLCTYLKQLCTLY